MISIKSKQIAVLIDPDKTHKESLPALSSTINQAKPDFILIGGSTVTESSQNIVSELKKRTSIPIILFPGNNKQLCSNADGILLLSLISGRNPEYLIGQHIESALTIKHSGMEVIPTGYILIDGGRRTAVQLVSHTEPISCNQISKIINTAVAGELLGMKSIYLEAGSGAVNPIPAHVIKQVKAELNIPLIVGGGICNKKQIADSLDAGADMIVIGNHFEKHPDEMADLCQFVHEYQL